MMTSLYTGISGMNANGTALAVIGDNISNLNTNGFKNSRVTFGDVLSQTVSGGAGSSQVGRGVMIKEVATQFTQGAFESTGNALDLAIDGDGFFQVRDGEMKLYTRAGQFTLNKDGKVVNPDGYTLQAFLADPTGNITGTTGDLVFSNGPSRAEATTEASVAANLDARETAQTDSFTLDGNGDGVNDDPANYNSSTTISVYDSLGGEQKVTVYFSKTADNAWEANFVYEDPTDPEQLVLAGTQALTFDTDGSLIDDGSGTPIDFDFGGDVVNPQSISFDFGTGTGEATPGTGFDGTTQFSSGFSVSSFNQDGYGSGIFKNITFNENGMVSAVFTNGQTRVIGQIALGRFLDPGSLTKLGSNMFVETYDSGPVVVGSPNTSGLGRLLSNTLELSNVDLAEEFVKLISAQRAFQASSRIISTSDELMQELVNLKR